MLFCLVAADPGIDADVVLRNLTLYDGSGSPGVKGDLAIKGERIVAVCCAGSGHHYRDPRGAMPRGMVMNGSPAS